MRDSLHNAYHVSNAGKLLRVPESQIDEDPRGLVLMWEAPIAGAQYFVGIDPTVGIINWGREYRVQDDYLTDNGAIEIIRKGRPGQKDVQVCEYVAPIHSEDLADVANLLGRLYGLNEDDGQAQIIPEVWPGPGLPLLNKLIHHHGYTNLFAWQYLNTMVPKATGGLGWYTTPKSARDLWSKSHRLIARNGLVINSEYLVEEMADCILDPVKLYARSTGTRHDDRVMAINLALWAAHLWTVDAETEPTLDSGPGEHAVDFQQAGLSDSEYEEALDARWNELLEAD